MKVVKWINEIEASNLKGDDNIGGMGGFFKDGMRWKDYIERYVDVGKVYFEALRQSIVENEVRMTGEEHDSDYAEAVPVFEDGKFATFSWRAWGDLMAAVWSEHEDKDYNYMDFYM